MAVWQDDETTKLLELWGEESVQASLEGCIRNITIYDKIAAELTSCGYQRTGMQCRERVKKLKKDYKKTKDNLNETGNKRKLCKFYEQINCILEDRPSTKPAIVLDSSDYDVDKAAELPDSGELQSCIAGSSNDLKTNEDKLKKPEEISENDEPVEKDKLGEKSDKSGMKGKGLKKDDKSEVKKELVKRKKKPTREERMEKSMNVVLEKVMKRQQESDDKYVELELKRMKMEERIMEMENERRKEDRDFQFRMLSMMSQGHPVPFPNPYYTVPPDYSAGSRSGSSYYSGSSTNSGGYPMYQSLPGSSPDIA
ncbi:uncharacterized protein [Dysidea avara]|uniref:uncharacterized protein n=1 Tax=Dysidea avara TaxID=196820 RepID=UPI00332CB3A0